MVPRRTTCWLGSVAVGFGGRAAAAFPQAFTHLSLINASPLNDQLDRAAGTDPVVGQAPASADR